MRPIKIGIEVADNGAVLTIKNHGEYNEGAPTKFAYQFDDEEPEALVDMLYVIRDVVGMYGNKYDKKRVQIQIEHGDHYECKEKNCGVCGWKGDNNEN